MIRHKHYGWLCKSCEVVSNLCELLQGEVAVVVHVKERKDAADERVAPQLHHALELGDAHSALGACNALEPGRGKQRGSCLR